MFGRLVYFQLLCLAAFGWNSIVGDWVEIPFLQPSTTTTQKSIVIRKNIHNHPSFLADSNFMSQVLHPSSVERDSVESEEDEEERETSSVVNHATLSPVRISSLVDFEEFVRSSTTTEGPISSAFDKYSNFQKRIYEYPRVNVSSNLEWPSKESTKDQLQFVTANRHRPPSMEYDRQPMSNKYQEESIEYSHPVQTIHDRVEIPVEASPPEEDDDEDLADESSSEEKDLNASGMPQTSEKPSDRFNDFDDYDEQRPDFSGGSFKNVTIIKRRRRPGTPGRVTIVKVIPPRRRFRPVESGGNEGGLSGFINFLKKMQDKFMQRTAKNIGDKIKVLQELKDQLILSIERRMSTLWRDPNTDKGNHRVKRSGGGGWMEYGDHGSHGGMDFPSAEAALLTISFLTFAVFLIKLVLQVINTIKAKHYTYNTVAGLNGINAAALKIVNRSKRDADTQDELWKHDMNILSAINDYKFTAGWGNKSASQSKADNKGGVMADSPHAGYMIAIGEE